MLNLEDSAWSTYEHAYGGASDIIALLSALSTYPTKTEYDSEPYFSLWSSLCHQGDTYSAAYAAVPHIVSFAAKAPSRITFDFLLLPTSIEIARANERGPDIPPELEADYRSAIQSLPRIVADIDPSSMDETMALVSAAAIAVAAGKVVLAEAILELEGEAAQQFLEWKANL